jgi:hypothetical protein
LSLSSQHPGGSEHIVVELQGGAHLMTPHQASSLVDHARQPSHRRSGPRRPSLPGGVLLHRRPGRKQWHYGPTAQELEARLKAQQLYEQLTGNAQSSLGAAFWELRFPKG